MALYHYLAWASLYCKFIPVVFFFMKYNQMNRLGHMIGSYAIGFCLFDLVGSIMAKYSIHNLWLYGIWSYVGFVMLYLIYRNYVLPKKSLKYFDVGFMTVVTLCIVHNIYFSGIYGVDSIKEGLISISLIFLTLFYFRKIFKELIIDDLFKVGFFIFNSGILLFYSGTLFFSLIQETLYRKTDFEGEAAIIQSIFEIIFSFIISWAFLCPKPVQIA